MSYLPPMYARYKLSYMSASLVALDRSQSQIECVSWHAFGKDVGFVFVPFYFLDHDFTCIP